MESPPELGEGSLIRYRLQLLGVPVRWLTRIERWSPPNTFVDVQLRGPYRLWEHTHRLTEVAHGTEIHDHVRYGVPIGGPVAWVVARLLDAIFDFRAAKTAELLADAA